MQLLGVAQESLAVHLGCTRGAIGHYLNGRRSPSFSQIKDIAIFLNVSPGWLLYGVPDTYAREPQSNYQIRKQLIPIRGTTKSGKSNKKLGYLDITATNRTEYALMVAGSDWSPRLQEGEAMLVDPARIPEAGDEIVIKYLGKVGLFNFIKETQKQMTVSEIMKEKQHRVLKKSDIKYMHVIIAVVRASCINEI